MTALILDGKSLATQREQQQTVTVTELLKINDKRVPILATILVGSDPASATYVKMKGNACRRVGMDSLSVNLPEETTTKQLLDLITELNDKPDVHGILLQHPVPSHIDERACFDNIATQKDVDGVTTAGFGLMAMGEAAYGSATPAGIMELLNAYKVELSGKHAVVVGRSPILGKPMAAMLLNADCTVTICHSRTKDLISHIKQADIIVGAVGKPEFIKASWIKDGAVVVDAGYHPGGLGDIEKTGLSNRVAAITPVPGGVGPMTINTLMAQTLQAAQSATKNNAG